MGLILSLIIVTCVLLYYYCTIIVTLYRNIEMKYWNIRIFHFTLVVYRKFRNIIRKESGKNVADEY